MKIYSQILLYEAKYTLAFQIVYTVVITRSKSSGVNMSIATEVCEYFENLIKSFNTVSLWKNVFVNLKRELFHFEIKLREQNLRIQEFESTNLLARKRV